MTPLLTLVLILATAQVASAGMEAMPTRVDLSRFTCSELLGLDTDRQERVFIYLTGVVDGRRRAREFDAEAAGKTIDRVMTACRATPSLIALDAFISTSP